MLKGFKQKFSQMESTLGGRIRSCHIVEFRNTNTINVQDNLDENCPLYIYFNFPSETNKIVSVKLSFWILNYRVCATAGISEVEQSPTIKFYISENNGVSYSDVYGGYTSNQSSIDISSDIDGSGDKLIKFTSDLRARLNVQIEIKLDIKAR